MKLQRIGGSLNATSSCNISPRIHSLSEKGRRLHRAHGLSGPGDGRDKPLSKGHDVAQRPSLGPDDSRVVSVIRVLSSSIYE